MTDFDESIPSSRRLFRRRLSASRIAEIGFGWIAKGTMVVAGGIVVVLGVLLEGPVLTDAPSTRKQWLALAVVILLVVAAVVAYHRSQAL